MDQPLIRLALVSGSPLVRAGLRAGLASWPGFELAATFDSLAGADAAAFGQARVAVVDLDPDDHELPAPEDDSGPALVLLVAGEAEGEGGAAAEWLAAGHSVLARDASLVQIGAAVQAAAAGLVASERPFVAHAWGAGADAERRAAASGLEALTPREHEVLARMTEGLGNREIAEALHISPHTAKFHVAQIIAKLAASSRAHAVAKALRAGLVAL